MGEHSLALALTLQRVQEQEQERELGQVQEFERAAEARP